MCVESFRRRYLLCCPCVRDGQRCRSSQCVLIDDRGSALYSSSVLDPSPTRPRPSPPMKTRARFLKRKAEEDAAQVEANQLHLAMTSTRNVRQKLNAEEDAAQLDVDKLKLATVRARLSTTRRANTKKAADKRSDNAVADVTTSNLATDDLPCAASSASISTFTPDAFESTAATTTTTLTADVDVDIFTDVSIAARDQPVAMTAADEPTIMTTTGEVIPPETRDLLLDLAVEHALSVESAIPNLDSLSDLRDDREVEAELAIGHAASCCVSRAVGLIGHAASCCVSRAVGRTLNEEHEREWLDRVDWIGGAATRHMRVTRISDDVDEDSDDADMPPLEDISDNDIKIDFSDSESGSSWSSEHSK